MARRNTSFNKLNVKDPISESIIQWHYRLPTTSERLATRNKMVIRDGDTVKMAENADEIMQEDTFALITGFRVGDFEREIGGDYQAFSWNPADANYYPEWRQWLRDNAMDLVEPLSRKIYVEKPLGVSGIEGK